MEVIETGLPGVLLIRPRVFRDGRGTFLETWQSDRYGEAGVTATFVQDNVAVSGRGVLRGLHYQYPEPQGKLIMVLHGSVLDAVVDIRRNSPSFGRHFRKELSAENGHQLWIPEGFAHGYLALTDTAIFSYKCTRPYNPAGDSAIRFDDPDIGIDWGAADPILSDKDLAAPLLREIPPERLP